MTSARDNWDQHWDSYSHTAEENPAQNYRRELIFSLLDLKGTGKGVRILDIGSGQGDMSAEAHARFSSAEILGLDLSRSGVEISRRKVPTARFVQRNLMEPGDPPSDLQGWATHAICSEIIEHLDDPCLLLKNARQYMAPGCRLVVTAPGGPMSAFDKHIGHRRHWTKQEVADLLIAAGYATEHTTSAGFPFFNLYRCVVILRGRKLIDDVSRAPAGRVAWPARAAMSVFRRLIRLKLNSSGSGWQIVATARVPR